MDQVESLLNRPKLYRNIDGVVELGGGFMAMSAGLLLCVSSHAPTNSIWHNVSFVILVGVLLIIHYGSKAIKNHITYPRTGFIEYRKEGTVWPRIASALLGPLGLGVLFVARRRHWDVTAAVPLFGLLFAAAYAYGIARTVRWKWAVVCALTLGSLVIAFLPASLLGAVADDSWVTHPVRTRLVGEYLLTMMTDGTILLISGAISLWLYVRRTEAPPQEAQ